MPNISRYVEAFLGRIFYNYKHRDAGLFTKRDIFKDASNSLVVKCPELAESNFLKRKHTTYGGNQLPTLTWSSDIDTLQKIKEFALIVEDADSPLSSPIPHGLYYGIPSNVRSISHQDLLTIKNDQYDGMKHGLNLRKTLYTGARPLVNHGPHRYFFQLIGVNSQLGLRGNANIEQVATAMQKKIVAYGIWIGVYERKLHEDD